MKLQGHSGILTLRRPHVNPIELTRRRFAGTLAATFCVSAQWARAEPVPARIVSTAPSSTEALFALGLGSRVVGVSIYCDYPPEAKALPKVGTYVQPNVEAIARLRPDLVVLQRHPGPITERLAALGIRFVQMPYGSLADVYTGIELVAHAAGVAVRGDALNGQIRSRLAAVQQQSGRVPRVRTCVIADRRAGMLADMVAVGPGNYVNEIMEIAGGLNVLDQAGLPMYPHIALETILRDNPEVIVDLTDAHALDESHQHVRDQDLALWHEQQTLLAARSNRVYLGNNSVLLVPGPRTPDAAEQFFRYFHQAHA